MAEDIRFGQTLIQIIDGDITSLAVDAILCPANTGLFLGGSASVAGALIRATDGKIQEELAKVKGPIPLGGVVVTPSAGLKASQVIHAAVHGLVAEEEAAKAKWSITDRTTFRLKVVAECIDSAIAEAAARGYHSLATPLLAAGSLGVDPKHITTTMITSLAAALGREDHSLEDVLLVVYHDEMIKTLLEKALANVGSLVLEINKAPTSEQEPASTEKKEPFSAENLLEELALLRRELADEREKVRALDDENTTLRIQVQQWSELVVPLSLPMPVAIAQCGIQAAASPSIRVENFRKGLTMLLRYLAMITLAEYEAAEAFDNETNDFLKDAFASSPTDGAWLEIASRVATALDERPLFCVEELPQLLRRKKKIQGPLYGALRGLVDLRNSIHDAGLVDESTSQIWLQKAIPSWNEALKRAEPLLAYRPVSIDSIEEFIDTTTVRYVVRWLVGEAFFPHSEHVEWHCYLKKGDLYLTSAKHDRFLPLKTMMQFRNFEVTKTQELYAFDHLKKGEPFSMTFRFHQQPKPSEHRPRFIG